MSNYTTEIRYICEQYAGLKESVGLSQIDTVLDAAIPKVFDFDFPIFEESYRAVLERKILMHFYTREIGYETVGRWKLRLRSKLNEVMPYYNELYKNAGQFGRINIFDNVDYTTTRDTDGSIDNDNEVNATGNESESVNENNNITREGTETKDVNKNDYLDRTIDSRESGSVDKSGIGYENIKDKNTNERNVTGNAENQRSGTNVDTENGETVNTGNSQQTGDTEENLIGNRNIESNGSENISANSSSESNNSNNAHDVKRRLFSDTPSGALDFGVLGAETGGDGTGNITNNYITNLTKDIGDSNSGGTASSLSDNKSESDSESSSKERESQSRVGSSNNEVSTENREVKQNNKNVNWTEGTVGSNDEHETQSGSLDRNVSTQTNDTQSSVNDSNKKENESRSAIENLHGESNYNDTENKDRKRTVNNSRVQTAKGLTKTTENFVETVKGKLGDKTYSSMFAEFTRSLINVDLMVIEELEPLFMGLWE